MHKNIDPLVIASQNVVLYKDKAHLNECQVRQEQSERHPDHASKDQVEEKLIGIFMENFSVTIEGNEGENREQDVRFPVEVRHDEVQVCENELQQLETLSVLKQYLSLVQLTHQCDKDLNVEGDFAHLWPKEGEHVDKEARSDQDYVNVVCCIYDWFSELACFTVLFALLANKFL